MEVPTSEAREALKTTLFNGEMQTGQEVPFCSFFALTEGQETGSILALLQGRLNTERKTHVRSI